MDARKHPIREQGHAARTGCPYWGKSTEACISDLVALRLLSFYEQYRKDAQVAYKLCKVSVSATEQPGVYYHPTHIPCIG